MTTAGAYLILVAACLVAGAGTRALLRPAGRWLTADALPLGACALIALLYPLAVATRAPVAVAIALAIVAAAFAVGAWRRRRGGASIVAAFAPGRRDLLLLVGAVAGGLVALIPVLAMGVPGAATISISDVWVYAHYVEELSRSGLSPGVDGSPGLGSGVGVGYELLANVPKALLGLAGYEVVAPAAALAIPLAATGWTRLFDAIAGVERWRGALAGGAAASPLLVFLAAEGQAGQLMSLAIWPFAVGTALALARERRVDTVVMAALGSAGVLAVYPALVPWLVPALLVCGAAAGGSTLGQRARRGAIALALLAAAVIVLAPVQTYRAFRYVTGIGDVATVSGFPVYGVGRYAAVIAGAVAPLGDAGVGAVAVLGLVVVAAALGLAIWARRRRPTGRLLLALLAITLALSVVVFARARWVSEDGYVALKALISAGALLAGLLAIALLLPGPRRVAALGLAALAACAAVWVPQSGDLLARASDGEAGFREGDVALGEALRELPLGTVMVDSALEATEAFRMRGTVWHLAADAAGLGVQGAQGDGGAPLPLVPWDYVVERRFSPFSRGRTTVWEGRGYRLAAAGELDVAPWGGAWHAPERRGNQVWTWTYGPVDLIVSNRSGAARTTLLRVTVASHGRPRDVVLAAGEQVASARVPADRSVTIPMPLVVPARATLAVSMASVPGPTPASGRPLALRLEAVSIADAARSPAGAPGSR